MQPCVADASSLQSQLLSSVELNDASVRIHGAAVRAKRMCKDRTLCKVRLEGSNPYMLLALLTVTRDPSKQQRGAPRPPAINGHRMQGRGLQSQITTASSFLRMHLPGYVIQTLQKLPSAACSPTDTLSESDETSPETSQKEVLKESPLLAALMQADGTLRALTHSAQTPVHRTPHPGAPTGSASTQQADANKTPGDTEKAAASTANSLPASGLFAAVARSSANATSSSVFGDTTGSVVLVDIKRQRAHTVSWGDTHGAHITNAVGHSLDAHVRQEHRVHGTSVLTASYGSMHGAHNIVLGSRGLWRYIHPSKAGLHAAAHANMENHLSTNEHQHDAASAVLRAALRSVVTRCAAAPTARTAVLNTLSQLDRLSPGSKSEARRDRLVPRSRGDIHPDLTAAVGSIVLPNLSSSSSSSENRTSSSILNMLQGERSDMSLSTDSSAFAGAFSSKSRPSGSITGSARCAGPMAHTGSSVAQIEHMRHCEMCGFAAKHFHGEELLVRENARADSVDIPGLALGCTQMRAGNELPGSKDMFLSATDEPTTEIEEEEDCVASEASEVSQQTPPLALGGLRGSRTAWSVPEDATVSHACDRVPSCESCTRSDEDLPASSLVRVATGAFCRTPRTPGKTLTVMKGMLHGSRSREILSREGSGLSLGARSRSMSNISCSSGRSSHSSYQKCMVRTEAQRRWALLARHTRLLALEQELRRSMWMAAVNAATVLAAQRATTAAEDAAASAAAAAVGNRPYDERTVLWRSLAGGGDSVTANPLYESIIADHSGLVKGLSTATDACDSNSVVAVKGELPAPDNIARVADSGSLSPKLSDEATSLGLSHDEVAPQGCRKLMACNSGGIRRPLACRRLNVDSLAGPGAASSLLPDEEFGLFGEVSMMGGASILE